MKKLRVLAVVFDMNTQEYVQRINEMPISKETAELLCKDQRAGQVCPIRGYGHGDSRTKLPHSTPLANQKRFHVEPQVEIVEVADDGTETIIGGWRGM